MQLVRLPNKKLPILMFDFDKLRAYKVALKYKKYVLLLPQDTL